MLHDLIEPTDADLADIEREWPLIAAELDELDAEIALILAADGGLTALDWRRHRRAEARVTRALVVTAGQRDEDHVCDLPHLDEAGIAA